VKIEAEQVSTVLPGVATSPRLARRFVDAALEGWALEDLRDAVELLTCELVTNIVLHVRGNLEVRLRRVAGGVRVEVSDSSPIVPRLTVQPDDDVESTTGRGLVLIEALSAAWGVETGADGKTVWFEVVA
jgi:anti-sigma regulatory factor (Ser/Thr protein kinase)